MIATLKQLPRPVQKYLAELECEVKQRSGVVPESVLCDAREYLQADVDALNACEPNLDEQQIYQHFVQRFGTPHEVAEQYEESAASILLPLPGYAPGWRICCSRCGRSAPANRAGIVRLGASSAHKYVLGWCRECHWFRWLRLQKDLNSVNLTESLGSEQSEEEYRATAHRPWIVIVITITIIALTMVGAQAILAMM